MRFDWLELLKILLPATASLVPTIWTIIKSAKQTRKTLETRMDCFEAKLDNHIATDDSAMRLPVECASSNSTIPFFTDLSTAREL